MSISQSLFGEGASGKGALTFESNKKTELDLFAVAPQIKKESRRDKRRRLEGEAIGGKKVRADGSESVLDNVLLLPAEDEDENRPAKRKNLRHAVDRNEDEDRRTVFVGNLCNTVDKKQVAKAFKDCGEVESVRIRNQVLEQESEKKRGRAVRILRGEVKQGEQFSASAYVLFKKDTSIKAAIGKTGVVLGGRHIFVTKVDEDSKTFSPSTSIFLGNLAYDTSEEDVWAYFTEHGFSDVRRVRLVRDKETGSGKGFGYVEFSSAESANKAITTRGNPLRGRDVRICHVTKDLKASARTAKRRDLRKNQVAVASGPQRRGERRPDTSSFASSSSTAKVADDHPSWMGFATNPRKKLARDLRPLITASGKKPVSKGPNFAKKAPSAGAKKAPPKH